MGDAELARLIVHQGNPTVRGVKRIKDTGSIAVLFDGGDVPNYIRVDLDIVRCYLYRKQIEDHLGRLQVVGHSPSPCDTDPSFPSPRNGPPKRRIKNLTDHKLDPLPSSPKRRDHPFYGLIGKAAKMATDTGIPLIVAGVFNAPHSTWGYVRDSPKGASVCKAIQDFNFTLLPDLSLVGYGGKSSWRNMGKDLASDHLNIERTLHAQCKCTRIQHIVNWDLFFSSRIDKAPPSDYAE
ncbi:hypothetical protein HPB51_005370 [Rhipicephalus microplus]|uniref:Tick transposon n=1 Tax=Rhipicephalus microplus TaxID=6941 RepID=A0A9J6EXS0_RHIMP|nr:hypothetical protein HPB51_005370 [Rhipicephalus microplus]